MNGLGDGLRQGQLVRELRGAFTQPQGSSEVCSSREVVLAWTGGGVLAATSLGLVGRSALARGDRTTAQVGSTIMLSVMSTGCQLKMQPW